MLNKDKLNNFLQFVINYLLMPIAIIFLLVMCIIIFATTSHAAVPQQAKLPYFVDSENFVNADGYTLEDLQNFYDARWGNAYPKDFTSPDVLIYEYQETISNVTYNFTTVWIPNASNYTYEITLNESYNAFDTDINQASIKFRGYSYVSFSTYRNRYNDPAFTLSASVTTVTFFYNANKDVTYISNPFYYLASSIDGANDYPVFAIPQPVFPTGHATPPDLTDEDLSVDDSILDPPTWETPSNPPTFDSTDIPGSIYNLIEWGIADPNGPFHTLKNNLQSGFQWLVNVISGYGQAIINNIQSSIQNLYDNFVSLFEPISENITGIREQIQYITQPLDSSAISAAFNENGLIQVKNDFIDFFNDFDDIIRNTPEPDTFDITINVQNVRSLYDFGVRSPVVLHLGNNLNGTLKTAFRAFLWVLVIVGSIFLTEKNLSAWIKGGGFSDK